jgi:hypothetical protein
MSAPICNTCFGVEGHSSFCPKKPAEERVQDSFKPGFTRKPEGKKGDPVNHPSHYTAGKVECIDALEAATTGLTGIEAVCTAAAIKYLWRWKLKNGVEDLEKARWYLDRLIKLVATQASNAEMAKTVMPGRTRHPWFGEHFVPRYSSESETTTCVKCGRCVDKLNSEGWCLECFSEPSKVNPDGYRAYSAMPTRCSAVWKDKGRQREWWCKRPPNHDGLHIVVDLEHGEVKW